MRMAGEDRPRRWRAHRRRGLRPRGNLGRRRREFRVEVQLIFQILRFERCELLFQLVLVEVRGVPHGLAQGVLHLPHLLRLFVDVVHDLYLSGWVGVVRG